MTAVARRTRRRRGAHERGQTLPTKLSAVDVASCQRRLQARPPPTRSRRRGSSSSSRSSSSSLQRLFAVGAASTTSSSAADAAVAKSPAIDCEEEAEGRVPAAGDGGGGRGPAVDEGAEDVVSSWANRRRGRSSQRTRRRGRLLATDEEAEAASRMILRRYPFRLPKLTSAFSSSVTVPVTNLSSHSWLASDALDSAPGRCDTLLAKDRALTAATTA